MNFKDANSICDELVKQSRLVMKLTESLSQLIQVVDEIDKRIAILEAYISPRIVVSENTIDSFL